MKRPASGVNIELVPGRAQYLHSDRMPEHYNEPITQVDDIHSIADYMRFSRDRIDALSYLCGKLLNIALDIQLGNNIGNWGCVVEKVRSLKTNTSSVSVFWAHADQLEKMTSERIDEVLKTLHEEMLWRMQNLGVDFELAFKGYNIGIGGELEKDVNEFRKYLDDEIAIIKDAKARCTVDRVCPGMLWKIRGKLREFLLKLADKI